MATRIDENRLRSHVNRAAMRRARLAIALYKAAERKHQSPSYPFARANGRRGSSVRRIPGGIRIEVSGPGAEYLEHGNENASGEIRPRNKRELWLMLKNKSAPGLRMQNPRIQKGRDGKFYLVLQKVRTYPGRKLLERSVRRAFGLRVL